MKKNFDSKEIIEKINIELPMEELIQHIIDNNLIHETLKETINEDKHNVPLVINKYILEADFDLKAKPYSNRTNFVCPFHDTLENDSTYYYNETNRLICKSANCAVGNSAKSYSVIDVYQMLVFATPPSLLYVEGNKEFAIALRECAKICGINFEYDKRELTPEEKFAYKKNNIYKIFIDICHQNLLKNNDFAKKARNYLLEERGFKALGNKFNDFIKEFEIGYAGGKYGSTYFYKIMKTKGFTDEELLASGLFGHEKNFETNEDLDKIIDRFRSRIIFGYKRGNGVYDGIYGRDMTTKSMMEQRKSKLSPEAAEDYLKNIKKKRHYRTEGNVSDPINFHEASKYEGIIVLEGEMDYLTLRALGFKNVICTFGTNGFKKEFIDKAKLRRIKSNYTKVNTFYLCYDSGDANNAGENAMFEVGKILKEEGFDVRIVRLEDEDPNDCFINHGMKAKEIIEEAVEKSITFEAFYVFNSLLARKLKSPADFRNAFAILNEFIPNIPKHELIWIVLDLINLIKTNTTIVVNDNVLLYAFGLSPENDYSTPAQTEIVPPVEETPKPFFLVDSTSLKTKKWAIFFDKKERYEDLNKRQTLSNIICSNTPNDVITCLKAKYNNVTNVIVDSKSSAETIQLFVDAGLTTHLLNCENFDELEEGRKLSELLVELKKEEA